MQTDEVREIARTTVEDFAKALSENLARYFALPTGPELAEAVERAAGIFPRWKRSRVRAGNSSVGFDPPLGSADYNPRAAIEPGRAEPWEHAHSPCGECWKAISDLDSAEAQRVAANDELEALRREVRALTSRLANGDARLRELAEDRDEWEREAHSARERVEFLERRAEGDTKQAASMLEALRAAERERDELRDKLHTIGAALGAAVSSPA